MKISTSQPSDSPQNLDGSNLHIAIILSRFNDSLGSILYKNTHETLLEYGVKQNNIQLIRVPGALETPLAAKILIEKHKPDAVIALGIVIKGDTPHFEHVCTQSHRGLMDTSLQTNTPIIFGIITALTQQQAIDRVDPKKLNKGREFAQAAIEMAQLIQDLQKDKEKL